MSRGNAPEEAATLRDLTAEQWRSGIAAWLGWLFDGLDMHLYTLVATVFVAELLQADSKSTDVRYFSSIIQAAFLVGWSFGGSLFGVVGDRLGRTRALVMTILTYALFTGLSFFAQTWWQLMIFRFVAALGIGGEWAVGASLLSETWPKRWRPWIAAVLQSAVNIGVVIANLAVWLLSDFPPRYVFLVGVIPAFLVLWIRRAVPETEAWQTANASGESKQDARISTLFGSDLLKTTVLTLAVCALTLTAHWAFMFWFLQHLRGLPELATWSDGQRTEFVTQALTYNMIGSVVGNFAAAAVARVLKYRLTIVLFSLAYAGALIGAYGVTRTPAELLWWVALIGGCSGMFGLFTMYLPPLFPTLVRTTGAGFCYNFGRLAAAVGTVVFGLYSPVGDYRTALCGAGILFIPAAVIACALPEPNDTPLLQPVE